jgi:hypothetical protein
VIHRRKLRFEVVQRKYFHLFYVQVTDMINKLNHLKFAVINKVCVDDLVAFFADTSSCKDCSSFEMVYDIIFDVSMALMCISEEKRSASTEHVLRCLYLLIVPGGQVVTACVESTLGVDAAGCGVPFCEHQWVSDNRSHCSDKQSLPPPNERVSLVCATRRAICCNTSQASYWGSGGCARTAPDATPTGDVLIERQLLEELTVTRPARCYNDPSLCVLEGLGEGGRRKAAEALSKHGVCIIRRLFDPQVSCAHIIWDVVECGLL